MTLASPLPEVYTTHKVSYVNERGGNCTSFTGSHVFRDRMVSEKMVAVADRKLYVSSGMLTYLTV